MEQVLLIKEEPEFWEPTEDDMTMNPPELPNVEGLDEEAAAQLIEEAMAKKKQIKYETSDTKYILPTTFCDECDPSKVQEGTNSYPY